MMNLNDTISAFRCCTQIPPMCKECPLTEMCKWNLSRDRCKNEVKLSVYHWLKSQEPRVLTLEEASKLERDTVVWFESNGVNGPRPRVVHYTNNLCVTFTDGCTWRFEVDGYGKRFRLWTSRPDEKRRAETPWGAQEQREYEATVEMAEYCERYEPTYNADDGSM